MWETINLLNSRLELILDKYYVLWIRLEFISVLHFCCTFPNTDAFGSQKDAEQCAYLSDYTAL